MQNPSLPSSKTLQTGRSFGLEDVVAYCKCPLKQRYRAWGEEEGVVDAREAIRIAARDAIRAYMTQGTDARPSPAIALDRAVKTYKNTLLYYDRQGLFTGDFKFTTHFNFGLVMIRRFHEVMNHRHDRPIFGPRNCVYPVGDDFVVGDIDGFIAFNVRSSTEIKFGIVTVGRKPPRLSSYERVREGFAYGAFRRLTGDLRSAPIEMVNIDPWDRKILRYPISHQDRAEFEALASAAIHGIKNNVYVPQPLKSNCQTCSYESKCSIKYATPEIKPWHRREFLNED